MSKNDYTAKTKNSGMPHMTLSAGGTDHAHYEGRTIGSTHAHIKQKCFSEGR